MDKKESEKSRFIAKADDFMDLTEAEIQERKRKQQDNSEPSDTIEDNSKEE